MKLFAKLFLFVICSQFIGLHATISMEKKEEKKDSAIEYLKSIEQDFWSRKEFKINKQKKKL